MCLLQALQVLETLIIPETDKLDLRDKQAVSDCHFVALAGPVP